MVENRRPTSVSDAQVAAEEDYRRRIRRYTISMIIRVVCLLLAFLFSGWLRWGLLAGAIVFPWFAVVVANSRDERNIQYDVSGVTPVAPRGLPERPAPGAPEDASGPAAIGTPRSGDPSANGTVPGTGASDLPDPPDAPDWDEEIIIGEVLGPKPEHPRTPRTDPPTDPPTSSTEERP